MTMTATAFWLNSVFAAFDEAVMLAVHELYNLGGGFFSPFFELISFLGDGGIALIILSLILILFRKTRRIGTAMLLGLAIGALFTNLFLKVVIARPRPYKDLESVFYQLWLIMGQHVESDMSFPSGHTTAAFSAMTGLFFAGNKRLSWLGFIFAFLMGISRIYLAVHYPSDVLGGIVVGFIAGFIGALIAAKLPEKWYRLKIINRKEGKEECSDLAS